MKLKSEMEIFPNIVTVKREVFISVDVRINLLLATVFDFRNLNDPFITCHNGVTFCLTFLRTMRV